MIDTVEAVIKMLEDGIEYEQRPRELRAALVLLRRVRDSAVKDLVNGALTEADNEGKSFAEIWNEPDKPEGSGISWG